MNDLRQLRVRVINLACEARNLKRIIESEAFARAWDIATPAQRAELDSYIVGVEKRKVDAWLKRVLAAVNLNDKSVRELRELARAAGCDYYHHKTKEQLINALQKESV